MVVAYVRDDADREVLAELAQRRLVTLARSARDAIALTRTVDFARVGRPLCVLGMESLPGAAPGEFARWLRAEAPECPLIIRYDFRSALIRHLSPAIPAHRRDIVVTLISCCAREILEGEVSAALGGDVAALNGRFK